MAYDYQLVIIGAGSGGLVAAEVAGQLGLNRVALVEAEPRLGGECLHTGCVPSKSLLYSAKNYKHSHTEPWKHIESSIKAIENRSDNDQHLIDLGIDVHHGKAKFIDSNTILIGGNKTVTSKYFLISTGSKPSVPEIEGLKSVDFHTNETIFSLNRIPKSLIIIGGGPIGCELATAFALYKTKVTIIQSNERITPREEEQVSSLLSAQLESLGVDIYTNAQTTSVTKRGHSIEVVLNLAGRIHSISSDTLLVATGRKPVTELDLEKAGIESNETGVLINRYYQTTASNIYAVGDCTPSPKFTHLAGHQAGVAIRNMLAPLFKKSGDYLSVVPWITYTHPEIGRIGITEAEAKEKGLDYSITEIDLAEVDRAITENSTSGFVKVIVDKKGKLLGATVVAENASELLTPLSHIYYHKQSIASLAKTVIPYPTLASGLNLLATKYVSSKAKSSFVFKIMAKKW